MSIIIKFQVVINYFELVNIYIYIYGTLHSFESFDGRIHLLMQSSQHHLLKHFPLSLGTYSFIAL